MIASITGASSGVPGDNYTVPPCCLKQECYQSGVVVESGPQHRPRTSGPARSAVEVVRAAPCYERGTMLLTLAGPTRTEPGAQRR